MMEKKSEKTVATAASTLTSSHPQHCVSVAHFLNCGELANVGLKWQMIPCERLWCCHFAVVVVKKVMGVCHQDLILIYQQRISLKGTGR